MDYIKSIEKESIEVNSKRTSYFEFLYVFVLIIYAGRSNTFVENLSLVENPVGTLIPVLLSGILAIKWKIVFNKQFCMLILCYFIYFVAISIKYSEIRPTIFLDYLLRFFIVYSAIKALKFNLFIIYEYLLYFLAIIGLFLWSIQIILGGEILYDFINKIPSINSFSYVSGEGLNAVLYSILPNSMSLSYGNVVPRNCGFAWEPGGFAVYLCMAIFINLFINSDKNSKKRFWVLLFALLSTQSTTGYVIFMVLIIYHIINKKLNIVLILIPIMVAAIIFIFSLPFMRNKIVESFDQTGELDILVENSVINESSYSLGRFASFNIALKDFRNNPIFGLGTHTEESWTKKIGASISAISGIGYLLAQFGIVGFLFFIIVSIKSSFLFSKYYYYKGRFLLFLLFFLISISYTILFLPLIMCFWMFALFEHPKITLEE